MRRACLTRTALAVLTALALLTACESGNGRNGPSNEQFGAVLGAIGGAILGSQVGGGKGRAIMAVVGGAAGAYLGATLARRLSARDHKLATTAGNKALNGPKGKTVPWSNPDSGNAGSVTPLTKARITTSGASCRAFEQTIVTRDGQREETKGTACRQSDGTWKVVGS